MKLYTYSKIKTSSLEDLISIGHWGAGIYCGVNKESISAYSKRRYLYEIEISDGQTYNLVGSAPLTSRIMIAFNRLTAPWNKRLTKAILKRLPDSIRRNAYIIPVSLASSVINRFMNSYNFENKWVIVKDPCAITDFKMIESSA